MLLCFAEHQKGRLTDATLEQLGFARALADKAKWPLCAVVLGSDAAQLTTQLGEHGVERALLYSDARLDGYAPEAAALALADATRRQTPHAVLFAETPISAELAARLAAKLLAAFAPRCVTLTPEANGGLKATFTAYNDRLQAVTTIADAPLVVTVPPGIGEAKRAPKTPVIEEHSLELPAGAARVRHLETVKADPRSVPLQQAAFIVSGGNGVRDFAPLWTLADRLGAAVGGSRVVCDDGRLERARQIGESGVTVRPHCYLAFGISGASQHLRGMQDSKLIIAVNNDRYAPLMKLANMAVIADADAVLQALLEKT
jgi:electron transfer flavoprotein alpha subunit